jgi:hypothetical protein
VDEQPGPGPVAILASLVGAWHGRGTVAFPSMALRAYDEVVRFSARSGVSLDYWQRANDVVDVSMLHSETGIWRVTEAGGLEISVALPGATEVSEGTINESAIVLASTTIGLATTGARLIETARRYELQHDAISYEIGIATEGLSMIGHLVGDLRRSTEVD